ncbi:MAG: AI-2E family transporter [Actinomycetota bacterium]
MRNRDVVRITFMAAVTLAGLGILWQLRSVVLIAGVAFFFAVALEPGVKLTMRIVKRRSAAVAIMLLLVVGAVSAFVASLVPPISQQISHLIDQVPGYIEDIQDTDTSIGRLFERYQVQDKIQDAVAKIPQTDLVSRVGSVFGTVFGAIANFLVFLVLFLYFLANMPRVKVSALRFVPRPRRARAASVVEKVFAKVGGWMEGLVLIAVTAGLVAFVFLLIVGVPYPHALAMFVSMCALIPMVGATLGAIACALVAGIAEGPVTGIGTFAFFALYQQVENYVISPRIMKKTVDVSPATVILAAMAGGILLGPIGILLAVPASAAIKVLIQELMLNDRPEPETLAGPEAPPAPAT